MTNHTAEKFIVRVRIDCSNGKVHEFTYDWNDRKQSREAAATIRFALGIGDRVTSTKEPTR